MYKNFLNILLLLVFLCGNSIGGEGLEEDQGSVTENSLDAKSFSDSFSKTKIFLISGGGAVVILWIAFVTTAYKKKYQCEAALGEISTLLRGNTENSTANIINIEALTTKSKAFVKDNPDAFKFLDPTQDINDIYTGLRMLDFTTSFLVQEAVVAFLVHGKYIKMDIKKDANKIIQENGQD